MIVNPLSSTPASTAGRLTSTTAQAAEPGEFEKQLSTAIAESLRRLGVTPGQFNITINSSASTSPSQIVISYTPANQPHPAATTPPSVVRTNPFAGPDLPALPPHAPAPAASATPWAAWTGPADKRDALPPGGGQTTATGSPRIQWNEQPAANQYNYAGPAARNPYFTTPSNPLRDGYVLGFQNWFTQPFILGAASGPVPANKTFYSTEEGAQEALRIVQQFEPDASIDQGSWSGGPFSASSQMYYISLPGGRLLSAGAILANYYNGGQGVTTESDSMLERTLRMA